MSGKLPLVLALLELLNNFTLHYQPLLIWKTLYVKNKEPPGPPGVRSVYSYYKYV